MKWIMKTACQTVKQAKLIESKRLRKLWEKDFFPSEWSIIILLRTLRPEYFTVRWVSGGGKNSALPHFHKRAFLLSHELWIYLVKKKKKKKAVSEEKSQLLFWRTERLLCQGCSSNDFHKKDISLEHWNMEVKHFESEPRKQESRQWEHQLDSSRWTSPTSSRTHYSSNRDTIPGEMALDKAAITMMVLLFEEN